MSSPPTWITKFVIAVTGSLHAFRQQKSFWIHLPVAVAVVLLGILLRLEAWRWAVISLCIALVLSAELLNTAIEEIVAVIHPARDSRIGKALDAAAGGVLVAAIGAAVAGLIVLGEAILRQWF